MWIIIYTVSFNILKSFNRKKYSFSKSYPYIVFLSHEINYCVEGSGKYLCLKSTLFYVRGIPLAPWPLRMLYLRQFHFHIRRGQLQRSQLLGTSFILFLFPTLGRFKLESVCVCVCAYVSLCVSDASGVFSMILANYVAHFR